MTTAREQARKAVFNTGKPTDFSLSLDQGHNCADAASDVWEPIVRRALSLTEARENGNEEWADEELRKIKEALGGR